MRSEESSVKSRVHKSRRRQREAGLKRVEVLVPEEQADLVRAYAAKLRQGSQSDAVAEMRKLVAKAYCRFHASCLDNISVDPDEADFGDAVVVAAALMHRGNAEAFKLGRQIRALAK